MGNLLHCCQPYRLWNQEDPWHGFDVHPNHFFSAVLELSVSNPSAVALVCASTMAVVQVFVCPVLIIAPVWNQSKTLSRLSSETASVL
jgi:hypothetical protein